MSDGQRPPVLEMRGIRKEFPGVVALDGVDLTLEAGDVHMLLGENGAGKSTLMKILGGAYTQGRRRDPPQRPAVDIGSPRAARDLGIRVIYQELNLVPHLSVAENIFLGELPTALGRRHRLARAARSHDGACSQDLGVDAGSARAGRSPGSRAAADGGDRQGAGSLERLDAGTTRSSSWTSRRPR